MHQSSSHGLVINFGLQKFSAVKTTGKGMGTSRIQLKSVRKAGKKMSLASQAAESEPGAGEAQTGAVGDDNSKCSSRPASSAAVDVASDDVCCTPLNSNALLEPNIKEAHCSSQPASSAAVDEELEAQQERERASTGIGPNRNQL